MRVEPEEKVDTLARAVVDSVMEVHRALGPGFSESVYEEALATELALRCIPFERRVQVAISYKGEEVGRGQLDLLVADELIVELKAVDSLCAFHTAQVISYLKATRHRVALLVNFNNRLMKDGIRRIIHTP
jgi:GxxExxY protein